MNSFKTLFAEKSCETSVPSENRPFLNGTNERIFNIFHKLISKGTFLAMIAVILYYVYAFASLYNGSASFDWLLSIFSDFVEIMNFSLDESPYIVEGSSYPPIAIAILYPFALICKDVFARLAYTQLTVDELTSEVMLYPQFWIAILLFFAICSVLIVLLTAKLYNVTGKNVFKLASVIMLSAPFVYTVMRGNTIYFALIFLVVFLILKDSKSAALRELSYVFLAIAGAIKIYPLFFGVFLLRKKKIFASFRVAFYFALIFGLSFYFFKGGLDDAGHFVDNLGGFMSNELRLVATNNISLSAQLYKLLHLFIPRLSAETTVYTVLNLTLMIAVFLIGTYAAIATRSDLSRYSICFAVVTLIPSISYFYTIIFAILPFLEYIRVFDTLGRKKQIFYFISFAFLFTTILVFPKYFVIHSFVIIAIFIVEVVSVIKERARIKSN